MIRSMTAFAATQGSAEGAQWVWEIRSVNGRGLDVKLRLPEGFATIEADLRAKIGAVADRGNVSAALKLNRTQTEGQLDVDEARLDLILEALDRVQDRAFAKGVTLGQPTAADVLAQRGVLVARAEDTTEALLEPVMTSFETALADFSEMRNAEGRALLAVLSDQIDQIEALTADAVAAAAGRGEAVKAQMTNALARVMDTGVPVDGDRVAQELALLAVKSDVTEEIDRLGAHVNAARELLAAGGPVGRKLDFLTQEFNREANTLCSKAGAKDLTQIGLALKAVIDQMREQVQNVE